MAGNWNNSKENQTRWIFKDAMVKDLIETLVASKIEYGNTKGRGFDFEVGLSNCIQNYVRQCQRNNIRFFPSLSAVFFVISSAAFNIKKAK